MTLKTPNLDDRKFQDIVREARSKIPLYCPKWTDYNLSDPGITLIELFAWMVDLLLYRLNRVPEKNYIKFMELIGIRLEPAKPARVDVTFRLSAPQPEAITIPKGTEVATVRTETQQAISFTTDGDLTILIPTLAYALITRDDVKFDDYLRALKNPDLSLAIFQDVPQENNALYLGYNEDLSAHALALTIEGSIEGIGVDPRNPPLSWEYWDGVKEKWLPVRLEADTTGGLNTHGQVILHFPYTSTMREISGHHACWLRCRAIKPRPGQRPYSSSPKVRSVVAESIGGTVPASHAFRITPELLGRSDGTPGQKFFLQNTPVLSREKGETIEVETETEGQYEPWQEVADFADSGQEDRHFTLDSVSGEVQFGPAIRQPSGEERQYGKTPPAGRQIRFTSYRCGGGVAGNVGQETITVLKSSIPYVAAVTNFEPAIGGVDSETLENAKLRAPKIIRARTRAVTAEDFEYLALEASPSIARAKCLSPEMTSGTQGVPPGVVRLLLVPKVADAAGPIAREQLELPGSVQAEVQAYLDERRLLATRLEIGSPAYQPVAVEARIKVKAGSDPRLVKAEAAQSLYHFINPVYGGLEGHGWPFGRSLFLSEVYSIVQGTANVEYIEEVKLFTVDFETGKRLAANSKINIQANCVLCSHEHQIVDVEEE